MDAIRTALEGLAAGQPSVEPFWMIDGIHEGPQRATWIAVCSDGQVQLRSRIFDVLPNTAGKGRQNFDVEALGVATSEVLAWLANKVREHGYDRLSGGQSLADDEAKYTLKLAVAEHRFDYATPLANWVGNADLVAIHEAFCWVRDNVRT